MNYKMTKVFIADYLDATAEDLRIKLDPVYKKYGTENLAFKLDCNPETIINYRRHSNPRKPTLQNYLLLRALLEESQKQ